MTFSREEIAAFADGELDPARRAAFEAAMKADPALAEQVGAHRALRERLSAHFAPFMAARVPEQLAGLLQQPATIIDFAEVREKRKLLASVRWGWVAGPALAASLALALFMPRGDGSERVGGHLAAALDQQLVAAQSRDAPQRILLSFRNASGEYCRAFTSPRRSGIACRESGGWRLEQAGAGRQADRSEYRMAGSATARLLERAQAMAVGPALDGDQEKEARARGWR